MIYTAMKRTTTTMASYHSPRMICAIGCCCAAAAAARHCRYRYRYRHDDRCARPDDLPPRDDSLRAPDDSPPFDSNWEDILLALRCRDRDVFFRCCCCRRRRRVVDDCCCLRDDCIPGRIWHRLHRRWDNRSRDPYCSIFSLGCDLIYAVLHTVVVRPRSRRQCKYSQSNGRMERNHSSCSRERHKRRIDSSRPQCERCGDIM
mmetsp:Transcript_23666/g.50142  ORF Transcript_23666/g.50142 Transcript_23666/m.50142 type:complete len:203 (+) Transcript_23666:638-1246(+)